MFLGGLLFSEGKWRGHGSVAEGRLGGDYGERRKRNYGGDVIQERRTFKKSFKKSCLRKKCSLVFSGGLQFY